MKFFQETTVWSDAKAVNGIYHLSDDKSFMVGYQAPGGEYRQFKRPIRFYTKGRKFTLVRDGEADSVYFAAKTEEAPVAGAIQVAGGGGKVYSVTKRGDNYLCTCDGFKFRRKCRHTEQVGAAV